MHRFSMVVLAAAAAAALTATAVVALPAIGDSGKTKTDQTGSDQGRDVSDLATCLAAHGLPGVPSTAATLKPWLADKEAQDPGAVKAALDACQASAPDDGAARPDAAKLIACVRSHGFDPPTAPVDFKRWVGEHHQAGDQALDDAVVACNDAQAPQNKTGDPGKSDGTSPPGKSPAAEPKKQG
jgi:hypothetical protein